MGTKNLNVKTIAASYIVFLLGWTMWNFCFNPKGLNEYISWGIGLAVHIVWWPLFALTLITKYDGNLMISFGELVSTKPKLKILIPLLALAVAYNLGVYFFSSTGFGTEMKMYDLIVTVLTVGIFEESVFRGWFLNAIAHFTGEFKANLISSALFVFIHYPSWILHEYGAMLMISRSIMIFILSLIFGWAFIKSRSIWTGAIFHSFWDFISFMI